MPRRDDSYTMTLEEYKAAQESKDFDALRRTGTDMAAHAPMALSQVCSPNPPCDGVNKCARHKAAAK